MTASEALHPEQFEARTNIGAKPGSQGTLFQGGYPTRYPRGYTPERMREVVGATVHSGLDPSKQHASRAAATAQVRDTVARSTVPVEHLRNVGWYNNSTLTEGKGALGTYNGPSEHGSRAQIHIAPGGSSGLTPIHEIGHHVSATVDKNYHAAYDSPRRRGEEEGYAENYAETHFRDRRGKQRRSTNTALDWSERERSASAEIEFKHEFDKKRRQSPLHPTQFDAEADNRRQLPPGHIPGQVALIDKVTSHRGFDYATMTDKKETRWDYTHESGLKRERG